ncbi:hypothetical protein E3U36_02080 [Arsenophonus endosymbiont of Aphis craccivora]|uniref:hypothetical protein n=1 Tax=Arsenophonus endosymbiont of Aphis craccivora TaxID=1231049 RepID=UPI0015DCAAB2|nr:hypothetical protein [Arsenophonus endosymbiont of Aphis craccivora]QLK87252.1 hypothetical protein E3U36_02080 [Arsenophonus endosymbiont of Aphis craccivora]
MKFYEKHLIKISNNFDENYILVKNKINNEKRLFEETDHYKKIINNRKLTEIDLDENIINIDKLSYLTNSSVYKEKLEIALFSNQAFNKML